MGTRFGPRHLLSRLQHGEAHGALGARLFVATAAAVGFRFGAGKVSFSFVFLVEIVMRSRKRHIENPYLDC